MADDIAAVLAGPLTPLLLVPVEATVTTAGTRRVLRVLVDRDVGVLDPSDASSAVAPLSLDEVADATRAVGDALDRLDLMGERPYTLEVSSPGVGRPLSGYAALRRNVGRLVSLTVDDSAAVTGRVLSVTPDEVVVEAPATRKQPAQRHTLPVARVRSGAVQVEFSRADGASDQAGEGWSHSGSGPAETEKWSHSGSAPAETEKA
ncbi:MAG: ribosome maturation factor RimP [Lapillicoccus sp.]